MISRFAMSAECFKLHHVPSCLVSFVAVSDRNPNTVFSFSFSVKVIGDFGVGKIFMLCCVSVGLLIVCHVKRVTSAIFGRYRAVLMVSQ